MINDEIKKFEDLWKVLYSEGLEMILSKADNKDFSNIELKQFTYLHAKATDIIQMKSIKIPARLIEKIEYTVKIYSINRIKKSLENIDYTDAQSVLFEFCSFWNIYSKIIIKWIIRVFSNLNRANESIKSKLSLRLTLINIVKDEIFAKLRCCLIDEFFETISSLRKKYLRYNIVDTRTKDNEINNNLDYEIIEENTLKAYFINDNKTIDVSNKESLISTTLYLKIFVEFLCSFDSIENSSKDSINKYNNYSNNVDITNYNRLDTTNADLNNNNEIYLTNYYTNELEYNIVQHCLEIHRPYIKHLLNSTTDLIDYLEKSLLLISDDVAIYSMFLPLKTINTIKKELSFLLFYNNYKELIENRVLKVIESKDIQALSLIYSVFKDDRKNSVSSFITISKKYFRNEYNNLINLYENEHFNNKCSNLIENNIDDNKGLEVLKNISSNIIDSKYNINKISTISNTNNIINNIKHLAYYTDYVYVYNNMFNFNNNILENAYLNDNQMKIAFYEVLEHTQISNNKYNNTLILPFFLDSLLNIKFNINADTKKIEEGINIVFNLFNTIVDKDIFIEQYKQLLSLRLINKSYIDTNTENDIIKKLEVLAGYNYTSSLYVMIKEYIDSKLFSNSIADLYCYNKKELKENILNMFSILIIDKEKWPKFLECKNTSKVDSLGLPNILNELYLSSEKYYTNNFKNRNIYLNNKYSTCLIEGTFKNKKKYKFLLNNYQTSILLLFNSFKSKEFLIYDNYILSTLNISYEEYYCNINDLIFNNVLIRNDINKFIKLNIDYEVELFSNNNLFDVNNQCVVIADLNNNENSIKQDKVIDDRSSVIEAAIVRIMKKNNTLKHEELMLKLNNEIIMFKIIPEVIKKKIENLLERELILRDKKSVDIYRYNH